MNAKKQSAANPLTPLLESKSFPAFALIVAEDRVRLERSLKVLLEHFYPGATAAESESARTVEIKRLSGQGLGLDHLRDAVESSNTLSLFSSNKVLVLQQAEELAGPVEKRLVELSEKFHSSHACILLGMGMSKSSPLLKHCTQQKMLVNLERPKGFDWKRWVERELKSVGVTQFDEELVLHIEKISEGSLDAAVAICEHLALYVEGISATVDDLRSLFSVHAHPGEFEIVDALASGKTFEVERMARQLLSSGKGPFLFTALLNRMFTNYLLAKLLLKRGVAPAEVRTRLNMQPWTFQKMSQALDRFSIDHLIHAVRALARADSLLKNRSLGEEFVITQLLRKLTPPSRRAA